MFLTPDDKTAHQLMKNRILNEINRLLYEQKKSKKWLADEAGFSYGRLKRIFNNEIKLTVEEAEIMLAALESSFIDILIIHILDVLTDDILKNLKKYRELEL